MVPWQFQYKAHTSVMAGLGCQIDKIKKYLLLIKHTCVSVPGYPQRVDDWESLQ